MNFNNNNNTSLSKKNLLYSSFNQINDCIIFGTNTGFYVYTLDPFKKIIARKITGGVSIVKMLFKSNIILFVGNVEKGVYPNNKLIVYQLFKSGETYSAEIEKPFKIIVGNVRGIEGTYNSNNIDFISNANRLRVNTILFNDE